MKKVTLAIFLLANSAFASHPHDLVCTGSAKLSDHREDFILQHTIGRNYENGDPNQDSHFSSVEMRRCFDDYVQVDCQFGAQRDFYIKPGSKIDLTLDLKDSKKKELYKGKLLFKNGKVTLDGEMFDYYINKFVAIKTDLQCASQPWVNLTAPTTDGH